MVKVNSLRLWQMTCSNVRGTKATWSEDVNGIKIWSKLKTRILVLVQTWLSDFYEISKKTCVHILLTFRKKLPSWGKWVGVYAMSIWHIYEVFISYICYDDRRSVSDKRRGLSKARQNQHEIRWKRRSRKDIITLSWCFSHKRNICCLKILRSIYSFQ